MVVFRNAPPTISVIATGTKEGVKKRIGVGIYHVPYDEFDGLSGITSVPLAVGALMLIDGVIKKKGALTPEEGIDPDEFLKRMAPFCGKGLKGSDLLLIREEIL